MAKTAEEKAAAKAAKEAEKAAAKAAASTDASNDSDLSDKEEVTVSWRGNTRVYSKKIHGEDFLTLASEFAEKFGGVVA